MRITVFPAVCTNNDERRAAVFAMKVAIRCFCERYASRGANPRSRIGSGARCSCVRPSATRSTGVSFNPLAFFTEGQRARRGSRGRKKSAVRRKHALELDDETGQPSELRRRWRYRCPALQPANHVINVGQTAAGDQGNAFNDPATHSNVTNAAIGDTITFNNVGASPGFHNVRSDGPVTTFRCARWVRRRGRRERRSKLDQLGPRRSRFPPRIRSTTTARIHGAPSQGMSGTINVTTPVELQTFEVD